MQGHAAQKLLRHPMAITKPVAIGEMPLASASCIHRSIYWRSQQGSLLLQKRGLGMLTRGKTGASNPKIKLLSTAITRSRANFILQQRTVRWLMRSRGSCLREPRTLCCIEESSLRPNSHWVRVVWLSLAYPGRLSATAALSRPCCIAS